MSDLSTTEPAEADNEGWVAVQFDGDNVYADGIRSMARAFLGAVPDKQERVFKISVPEAIKYARRGNIDPVLVSDFFQAIAERSGLVERIGQDSVQKILANAGELSAEPRPTNGHAAEPPAPSDQAEYGVEGDGISSAVPSRPVQIRSSAQFVADYLPPDYIIVGMLQRRFAYSLTGGTGDGKTAIALLIAACNALGRPFGKCDVDKGRVLMFAGENPDDVRPRWIAMAQQMNFDLETIDVYFLPGVFKISEMRAQIEKQAKAVGEFSLIIVDSSAAYFEGDEENSNVQQGIHARRLRSLVTLPGGPCVLVLCHPVKNAAANNLIPRGGGAFLAELDGNLTVTKSDSVVELHWQGKFRGPDFAPMTFVLRSVTHERLKDTKGRLIPTVFAAPLSETAHQQMVATARSDENLVLEKITQSPKASQADIAQALGWLRSNGEPYKTRVARALESLREFKLATKERDGWSVTSKGEKTLAGLTDGEARQ